MTARAAHAIVLTGALLAACDGGREARLQRLGQQLARIEHRLREQQDVNRRLQEALRDAGILLPADAPGDDTREGLARKVEALEREARSLQRAVESRDNLEGTRAMQAIGELLEELEVYGERALPVLLSAAEDSEGNPQSTLLEAYARLGGRAVVPDLERLLTDRGKTARLRFQAARSLVELDPDAASRHVERLLDREPGFPDLYFLVFLLGESRTPAAVPVLCKALSGSEDPSIRCHAATALGNFPGDTAAAALAAAAAGDSYPAVRVNALRALSKAASAEAPEIARQVLEGSPPEQVRDAARTILGAVGKGESR